jgi:hypothetical protein
MSQLNQRLDFDECDCEWHSMTTMLSDSQLVAELPPALLDNKQVEISDSVDEAVPTHFMDMPEMTPGLLAQILEDQRVSEEDDKENVQIKQEPLTPCVQPEEQEDSPIPSRQPLQARLMHGSRTLAISEFHGLNYHSIPHLSPSYCRCLHYPDPCSWYNQPIDSTVYTLPEVNETPVSTRQPLQPSILLAPKRGGLDLIEFPLDSNDETIEWDDEDDFVWAAVQHSDPELSNFCNCHLEMNSSLPRAKKFKKKLNAGYSFLLV